MNDIKLIMFDLDGTLLNGEGRLSEANKEAIAKIREKGILVTLASGRPYSSMLPFARELGTKAPLVCYNGALVRSPVGELEILAHRGVPESTARKAVEILRNQGIHINAYIDDNLIVENDDKYAQEYGRTKKIEYKVVSSFDDIPDFEPTKLLAIDDDPEKISKLKKILQSDLEASVFRSSAYFCEILRPNIDKGWALHFLADHFGLESHQVMAFGDQENDMNMIRSAGVGVAMGNALDKVHAVADESAPHHHEDGVAQFLKNYFKL